MKYRRFAVLALGVLAFAAAGCGGDDSSSEASSDTQVEETATVDDTMTEDMTADDTTGDIDLGDLSGECLEFAGIGAKIAEAMGGTGGANADVEKTAELFDELVDNAPDEIKDDLAVLSEGIGKMAEAFKGVDFSSGATPDPEQLAKIQEVMGSLDSAELQTASQNIEAWAAANCKS